MFHHFECMPGVKPSALKARPNLDGVTARVIVLVRVGLKVVHKLRHG